MLANRNESCDSSRDIRNAPVTLISGLPAVSNHVLALAALLAKRLNEARSSRAIYASEQPMRLWGVFYIASDGRSEDSTRGQGSHHLCSGKL